MDLIKDIILYRSSIQKDKRPTCMRTTTITLTSCHMRNKGTVFDHDQIRAVFRKLKYIPVYYNGSKEPFLWRMFYSDFYNQLSIGYQDQLSTKKVKIFPNGSLQIAGCADMSDCDRFIAQLRYLLKLMYKIDIPRESFEIVMYNGFFSLNHMIDVYKLMDTFENKNIQYSYDPDRYAAVKAKVKTGGKKPITVSIFVSGSVLITGTKSPSEAFYVYKFIVDLLIHVDDLYIQHNDTSEKFGVYLGYPIEQWEKFIHLHSSP